MSTVPQFIRAQPIASDLLVVDQRVPLAQLIKAMSDSGFTVINDRTGRLVVTLWPQDYRVREGELVEQTEGEDK